MPDVFNLKSKDWELNVWVKDNSDRLQVLEKTMVARDRELPATTFFLSPPLSVMEVIPPGTSTLPGAPASELCLSVPVFFENKQYEFEFSFDADIVLTNEPRIVHRLAAIEDAFHFSKKSRSLRGSINFANDIGWFRLGIRYATSNGTAFAEHHQTISFEVLPTKMAMDTDLAAIHQAIDASYPLWRFSFAQKTEQELARSHKQHERLNLLWLAHFRHLRTRLEEGIHVILRSPHARLLSDARVVRLERLRGRLAPKLEMRVNEHLAQVEHHHRYQVNSRRLSVDTSENRFIKMVIKRCSSALVQIIRLAQENQKAPEEGGRLSESFFAELRSWKKPLDQLLNRPFFAEVGEYEGMERESLVLHQRAGYANIYRIWQELKMYLGIFGNHAAVSMKSVADLYEVWCFLAMKNMLVELGFIEQSSDKASLKNTGLEKIMVNGTTSAFRFYRAADKLSIRLSHEPNFGAHEEPEVGKIYSWTTRQRPDIFLEATFENGQTIRWIFDAKYRIWDDNAIDMAPEDAINQMHRYRDALIHIDKAGDGWKEKSRPVLGAFVLYPGWFDENTSANPYTKSIEDVGIGAFPLLPDRPNLWLRQFLEKQFGNPSTSTPYVRTEPDKYYVEDSARIAVTGAFLSRYHDLALVAHVAGASGRDKAYMQRFSDGTAQWYHVPVKTTLKKSISYNVMQETRYCALAAHVTGEKYRILKYIYEVRSVKIVKRCDLNIEQAGAPSASTEEYWLIGLGPSYVIPSPIAVKSVRHFQIFHTSANDLSASKKWEDLQQRYILLV